MSDFAFTDAFVSINSVDLSDHVKQVTLDYSAEMLDATAMGDGTRINLGGLKDWTISIEFKQDFTADEVDATLFSLVGASFPVIVRPVKSSAVGATNPNYVATGILESYSPLGNQVGELAMAPVTIRPASALARATS